MRWCSLLSAAILCLALQPLWSADPAHEAAKKEEAKKDSAEKKGSAEKKDSDTHGFDVPVPLGIPVKGIKIPHRDEKGKLVMTIEADVATKLDDQHVDMQSMKIESFDDDGKKINIELPHSIFNLETKILAGDSGAHITREDFEITGDSVEFNTKTRYATLRGKIRMVIQSADIEK